MVNPTLTFVIDPQQAGSVRQRLTNVDLNQDVPLAIVVIQDGQPRPVTGRRSVIPQGSAPVPLELNTNPRIRFPGTGTYSYQVTVEAMGGVLERVFEVQVEAVPPVPVGRLEIRPLQPVRVGVDVEVEVLLVVEEQRSPIPRSQQTWTTTNGPLPLDTNPASRTTLRFTEPGTYTYQVTVASAGQTLTQDVTLTVLPAPPAPNDTRLVNPPAEVLLPDVARVPLLVELDPSVRQSWQQLSGPAEATIQFVRIDVPTITFSEPGPYRFQVIIGDAQQQFDILVRRVEVKNQPPQVEAGPNQTLNLPHVAILKGIVSDDGQPNPPGQVSVLWRHVGGSGQVVFSNATRPDTTALFSDKGRYILTLTAHDGAVTTVDEVVITVNKAPVIQAMAPALVVLPGTATLSGQVLDNGLGDPANGTVQGVWAKVSGPGQVTFTEVQTGSSSITTATFSERGRYDLRYVVSNGCLATVQDVTVVASLVPLVQAGADQAITLPQEATLEGQVQIEEWPNARPLQLEWTKVEGPGEVTFTPSKSTGQRARTQARFSVSGTYILRLTSTDGMLTASDDVMVTVNPPTVMPRIKQNLVALYTFKEGKGSTVRDVSCVGSPMNLHIQEGDGGLVHWLPGGGLAFREEPKPASGNVPRSPSIQTDGPATKVIEAAKRTNQLTVEVWYRPGSDRPILPPSNPIRVLSIAPRGTQSHHNRNFILQQGQWQSKTADFYHVRLRSTAQGTEADEGLKTATTIQAKIQPSGNQPNTHPWQLNHVVYTWDGKGTGRIYVDGELQSEKQFAASEADCINSLSAWNGQYFLALGKDPDGQWPGRGEFQLVAIYDRALTAQDVAQNFKAGIPTC